MESVGTVVFNGDVAICNCAPGSCRNVLAKSEDECLRKLARKTPVTLEPCISLCVPEGSKTYHAEGKCLRCDGTGKDLINEVADLAPPLPPQADAKT